MSEPLSSNQEVLQEYEACEEIACPVCGSFSPSHIQEDDEGPCREVPPYWWFR